MWPRPSDPHTAWGASEVKAESLKGSLLNDLHLAICLRRAQRHRLGRAAPIRTKGAAITPRSRRGHSRRSSNWHFTDRYYHTNLDRPDKTSAPEMVNVGVAVATSAWFLASADEQDALATVELVAAAAEARLALEADAERDDRDPDGVAQVVSRSARQRPAPAGGRSVCGRRREGCGGSEPAPIGQTRERPAADVGERLAVYRSGIQEGDCMKRLLAVLLVGVAPLGATLIAQEKPNFVGTWKLSAPASADMFTPTQITVVQDATDLTVTTTGQMGEFKTPYKLDGSESRNPLDFQGTMIDRMTKLAWDGNKLVLTATSDMNGQAFEVKSIWTLTPDGTLSTETTFPDFQGGGAPITTKADKKAERGRRRAHLVPVCPDRHCVRLPPTPPASWLDLQEGTVAGRYRFIANSLGVRTTNQLQEKVTFAPGSSRCGTIAWR